MRAGMTTRALALGFVFLACTEGKRADAPPVVSVTPAPTQSASSTRPSAHRVHGAIQGRFASDRRTYAVAEPILIDFEARPTNGSLRVFVGGDGRNQAAFPTRVAVKAVDVASGKTVCDNVASPPFPSFGGPGSELVFTPQEPLRDRFVLNPACPGLGNPGIYRVTLHRRLTDLSLKVQRPGEKYPTSCDVHPIHEGPAKIPGFPECEKLIATVPSVTSEIEISITPYDASALRRSLDPKLDDATRQRVALWVCGWVACGCARKPTPPFSDILAAIPQALPGSFPAACP